jgi:hypothetical protein
MQLFGISDSLQVYTNAPYWKDLSISKHAWLITVYVSICDGRYTRY